MPTVENQGVCDTARTQTPATIPDPDAHATRIVYPHNCDLWLYDLASGTTRRLTSDGRATIETLPRFRDADTITFLDRGSERERPLALSEVDAKTLRRRTVLVSDEWIYTYAWTPRRDRLAFMTINKAYDRHTLRMFDLTKTREVRRFPPYRGRGTTESDEVTLSWSPDGTRLLVVDTHLEPGECPSPDPVDGDCEEKTVFVLDPSGRDVVAPRLAMMARWDPEGTGIVYRDWRAGKPERWHRLDVQTGLVTGLAYGAATLHLAFAPGGAHVAYDDGGRPEESLSRPPELFVFDPTTGRERNLGQLAVAVWLSADELLASLTAHCWAGWCDYRPWRPAGKTVAIRVTDGRRRALPIPSTDGADILYR